MCRSLVAPVDQRGTGESSRMDCPIDDDALLFEGEFTLEDTIQFIAECLENLPHDPRYFSTSVAVTDLEAIREALGYSALNLYGVSYGTRVAQHFARRYPDSTRTVVIDGVVPPQVALGPEIATESQKAVDRILARCAEDATCNERFPAVETTFAGIVAALREEPVEVSVPHPSTGRAESISFGEAELAGAVRLLAYSPPTIALLPLFVHEAGKGNWVPLASQYMMTAIAMSDALALGMHNTVMCTEDLPFLESIADKSRITLFANAGCAFTCPSRTCYVSVSKINKRDSEQAFQCSQSLKERELLGMIDFDLDALVGMGFHSFKLLRPAPGKMTGF